MNALIKQQKQVGSASSIDDLRHAMAAAIESGDQTQILGDTEHFHADGVYGRKTKIPAGATIITPVHKKQHITVALKGICTVADADGNKKDVFAPAVFVTEPGTQRAVYAHTEVIWFTAHACEETDLELVEQLLTCDSMAEYQQLQLEADL